MDWEMCGRISKAQVIVDHIVDTKIPLHGQGILGMHRRIQGRFRRILDARQTSDCLHFEEIEKAWGELRDARFGVISHHICLKGLETLPCWTKIELKTNLCGLQHIFMQSDLNARQRHWSKLLSEYDFEITYINGMVNRVADALSQRPHIFSVLPLQTDLREKILTLQHDEDWYKEVEGFIGQNTMMVPWFEGFSFDSDGLLRFRSQVYVPPNDELRMLILSKAHRAVYMAHPGVEDEGRP